MMACKNVNGPSAAMKQDGVFGLVTAAMGGKRTSWDASVVGALNGQVEVIEMIPPAAQTELTAGQSTREGYMPLKDYIDEVMSLFEDVPTPPEIAVERVRFLRNAEAENRSAQTFATLNAYA